MVWSVAVPGKEAVRRNPNIEARQWWEVLKAAVIENIGQHPPRYITGSTPEVIVSDTGMLDRKKDRMFATEGSN